MRNNSRYFYRIGPNKRGIPIGEVLEKNLMQALSKENFCSGSRMVGFDLKYLWGPNSIGTRVRNSLQEIAVLDTCTNIRRKLMSDSRGAVAVV